MTCIELGETTKANYCKNILLTATLKDLEKKVFLWNDVEAQDCDE